MFTQNHDQVANTLHGERVGVFTSVARYRALTALMLLAPQTPMLFMGQEFGATTPFLFFADYGDDTLVENVYRGRKEFLAQFPSYGSPEAQAAVPNPCAPDSFLRSKLDLSQRVKNAHVYLFHQDLLRLRREDPVIARQDRRLLDGAVLGSEALVLRFFAEAPDEDRLLIVNLGGDLEYRPAPEPLLAPPPRGDWRLRWSSDDPRYGGPGIITPYKVSGWHIPGKSATLFVGCKGDAE
jgi:maltooligosyltrehalose trehalohydrolase